MRNYSKNLKTLRRMLAFREQRLEDKKTSSSAKSYLRAEAASLRMALDILQTLELSGRFDDEAEIR